jgi:hypothetical protein
MCARCKGWGKLFHANWAIEYYGNGEEVKRKQLTVLHGETCRSCKGSGIKGGVLRDEAPPIMDLLKISKPETSDNTSAAEVQPAEDEMSL